MHQGSLRKKRVNTWFPQAVFCQSGKLRRTGEKRSSLRSPNGKGLKALVEVRQAEGSINFSLPSALPHQATGQSFRQKPRQERLLKCPPLKQSGNMITNTEPCFIHPKLLTGETQCRN
jgi:hypothetical protein